MPDALGAVEVDAALQSAGRITGSVSGVGAGVAVQVVAEDVTTRQILRSDLADATGHYSIGGLTPASSTASTR
jgi:hypothetical protein